MEEVVQTPYGEVRAGGLEELLSSFDTRRLLQTVEVIDRFCGQWKRELRDDLLAIHSMAHTLVNGAPLSAALRDESLAGAAYSVGEEFHEWRESLAAAVALLDQIADLEPD
jgi:hypothetical protein